MQEKGEQTLLVEFPDLQTNSNCDKAEIFVW